MWLVWRDAELQVHRINIGKSQNSIDFYSKKIKIHGHYRFSTKKARYLSFNLFENYLCLFS